MGQGEPGVYRGGDRRWWKMSRRVGCRGVPSEKAGARPRAGETAMAPGKKEAARVFLGPGGLESGRRV